MWVPMFKAILWNLYEAEIIGEDAILAWAKEHEDVDEADSVFFSMVTNFYFFNYFSTSLY